MKSIISYNVNSIRSAIRQGFWEWLETESPDVLCLQETKIDNNSITGNLLFRNDYYMYWHSAKKKGYSGVAVFSKEKPLKITYGCGIQKYDREGRVLRIDFKNYSVISVYVPSGSISPERQKFKDEFLMDFFCYIKKLKKSIPNLIISGDFNIAHQEIDLYNPKANKNVTKFLPHERDWMTKLFQHDFVDIFRQQNKTYRHYSWWSYGKGVREKDRGWRLDYHIASSSLFKRCIKSEILSNIKYSDHCPIKIMVDL